MCLSYRIGIFCIAGAEKDGRVNSAQSVENIQPVNTAHVTCHGSVTVKRAGVDCSATKVRQNPRELQKLTE